MIYLFEIVDRYSVNLLYNFENLETYTVVPSVNICYYFVIFF